MNNASDDRSHKLQFMKDEGGEYWIDNPISNTPIKICCTCMKTCFNIPDSLKKINVILSNKKLEKSYRISLASNINTVAIEGVYFIVTYSTWKKMYDLFGYASFYVKVEQ